MSRIPTNGIDYTSKDYESFRNDMIKQLRVKMPEYTDISQSDAGIVILELLAQGLDVLSYYQDVIANETLLVTEEQMSNALKWCQILGYEPRVATPAKFNQVFVLSSVQDTDTTIPKGTVVKTVGSVAEPVLYFETQKDLIIPAGALGDEKDEDDNYLYTVEVVEGLSVTGEYIGSSTEAPNQSFKLGYTPVIRDSISVFVNEGNGFAEWERVTNFVDSTATSRHYTAVINENDEAIITFGDGTFGKIPVKLDNNILCNYRVGGGSKGNVGIKKISVLETNLALVSETFNPSTAHIEGFDKETLAEIKKNAPNAHRTKWGALITDDFSDIIKMNFPEVDKVASYNGTDDVRNLDIYLLPKNAETVDAELSQDTKDSILSLFNENEGGRKIIGALDIRLHPAVKAPINLSVTIGVKDRYGFDKVKGKVEEFINNYFEIGNIGFNSEFIPASLCADIMNPENAIEGVRYVKITSPTEDTIVAGRGEIHYLSSLSIINGGE